MTKLNWTESAGGPLVLICDNAVDLWSGIYKRSSYIENKIEDADDFLDPSETDYGLACNVDLGLELIKVSTKSALVIGGEPMPTTIFKSISGEILIARWFYYGIKDSEHITDNLLSNLDLNAIENWEFKLDFKAETNKLYLFDSANISKDFKKDNADFIQVATNPDIYSVYTATYEPTTEIKLILHKFVSNK